MVSTVLMIHIISRKRDFVDISSGNGSKSEPDEVVVKFESVRTRKKVPTPQREQCKSTTRCTKRDEIIPKKNYTRSIEKQNAVFIVDTTVSKGGRGGEGDAERSGVEGRPLTSGKDHPG